jgi:hypothetical protein
MSTAFDEVWDALAIKRFTEQDTLLLIEYAELTSHINAVESEPILSDCQ